MDTKYKPDTPEDAGHNLLLVATIVLIASAGITILLALSRM